MARPEALSSSGRSYPVAPDRPPAVTPAAGRVAPLPDRSPAGLGDGLDELAVTFEADLGALWVGFSHRQHPCFTPSLLDDILHFQDRVGKSERSLSAIVWFSSLSGIWNLGGDLGLFRRLILAGAAEELRRYAYACVAAIHGNWTKAERQHLTIALVQGEALGGGFEAVLTNDVVIAERQARFGLPEVLFNMFPGMGAYSLLSRRLDAVRAEQMIRSGRIYSADDLADIGLVDLVVEPGQGPSAVREYLHGNRRRLGLFSRLSEVRRRCAPITLDELETVVDIWVETALALDPADLRRMQRLADAQRRRWSHCGAS